jgi:hypothetical protein
MKIFRILIALIIVISLCIGVAMPVGAISASPTLLKITNVNVYENCLETGDMLFWIEYVITYSSLPAETSSQTYIIRLLNSTTAVDIRDDIPYTYFNNGYSKNLGSIYFTAVEVSSLGLTWNANNYYIIIQGNPTANWVGGSTIPYSARYESINFNWKPSGTIGENQSILTPDLLTEAYDITTYWASPTLYQLTVPTTSGGYVLSNQGQQYFTAVLPNLSALAPTALLTPANSALLLATTPLVSTTPYAQKIGSDYQGSSLDLTGAASALHIGGMWLGILLSLGVCLFVVMHGTKEVNSYKPFILLNLPLLYVFTRIGWFPMPLTIGLALLASLSVWYSFFYEKSIS